MGLCNLISVQIAQQSMQSGGLPCRQNYTQLNIKSFPLVLVINIMRNTFVPAPLL